MRFFDILRNVAQAFVYPRPVRAAQILIAFTDGVTAQSFLARARSAGGLAAQAQIGSRARFAETGPLSPIRFTGLRSHSAFPRRFRKRRPACHAARDGRVWIRQTRRTPGFRKPARRAAERCRSRCATECTSTLALSGRSSVRTCFAAAISSSRAGATQPSIFPRASCFSPRLVDRSAAVRGETQIANGR